MKMKRRKTTSLPDSPRGADSDDRISDLPESILGHILSNLPIKNAVATGLLPKRWKFLWTTTANLDFSFEGGSVQQFVQSVNYVMLLHKPASHFNKLSLIWYAINPIPLYVNTWICTAVARDVHKLYIHVGNYDLPLHVQSYLFSSEKLMSLELRCRICISPEIVVSLPRLESLDLFPVSFQTEESFRKLLDGCPVLKRLLIRIDNRNSVAFKCIISSTSLKHLELSTSVGFSRFLGVVVLEAPSLEHIYLRDINSVVVPQRLNCLSRAFFCPAYFGQEIRGPNYCNSFVEALQALSCAKALVISSEVVWALGCATIKMETRFNRLTRLTLFICQKCSSAIRNLIELADNLKHLSINMYSDDNDNEEGQFNDSSWTKPNLVPTCLSNSLRSVSFHNFYGRPDVLAMIEYILKQGSVLNTINICLCEAFIGLKSKDRLVQLISTFPKKSSICEVKIVDSLLIGMSFSNSADSAIDAW